VELMFSTYIGPVLAMAELLSPCSAAPIGLQPFRFIAIDNAELRNLRAAIAAFSKTEAESPSASPWRFSRQTGDVAIPDAVAIVPE
jgi:nitroreductase